MADENIDNRQVSSDGSLPLAGTAGLNGLKRSAGSAGTGVPGTPDVAGPAAKPSSLADLVDATNRAVKAENTGAEGPRPGERSDGSDERAGATLGRGFQPSSTESVRPVRSVIEQESSRSAQQPLTRPADQGQRPAAASQGGPGQARLSAAAGTAQPVGQSQRSHPAQRTPAVPKARRMKLSLTKIDPWSVAKVSFLLSIAFGIIQIVAVTILWYLLQSVGLFDSLNTVISRTGLSTGGASVSSVFGLGTVVSWVTILAVFEVILIVILATISAFLYNVTSSLVGGVHITLGDD